MTVTELREMESQLNAMLEATEQVVNHWKEQQDQAKEAFDDARDRLDYVNDLLTQAQDAHQAVDDARDAWERLGIE